MINPGSSPDLRFNSPWRLFFCKLYLKVGCFITHVISKRIVFVRSISVTGNTHGISTVNRGFKPRMGPNGLNCKVRLANHTRPSCRVWFERRTLQLSSLLFENRDWLFHHSNDILGAVFIPMSKRSWLRTQYLVLGVTGSNPVTNLTIKSI